MTFYEVMQEYHRLDRDEHGMMAKEVESYRKKKELLEGTILSFDPGETTGVAVFDKLDLKEAYQIPTATVEEAVDRFWIILEHAMPDHVVIENYRIYGWKRNEHAWAELHTPKMVGLLEAFSYQQGFSYTLQMAREAKALCTDERLKEWGFYQRGDRHARDAIRHAAFFLLFNAPKTPCR